MLEEIEDKNNPEKIELPDELTIIPVQSKPVFPGMVTPLLVSKSKFSEAAAQQIDAKHYIGLILVKDEAGDIIPENLHEIGTVAVILKKVNLPDGGTNFLINCLKRFRVIEFTEKTPILKARVEYFKEEDEDYANDIEVKAYLRSIFNILKTLSENNPLFLEQIKLTMANMENPQRVADQIAAILNLKKDEYQELLEIIDIKKRLAKILTHLENERKLMEVQQKIYSEINDKINKQQREFYLREQLKQIKKELGMDDDPKSAALNRIREMLEKLAFEGEIKDKTEEEFEKLSNMDPRASEYSVALNYLELVCSLPWHERSPEVIDIDKAKKILDKDHYDLEDVKERILEFLAVRKLNPENKGSIICLVGPPGVGKTSLGKSIANALNRKFFRFSVGGMRDEAEIKGHRRTYVGAMPGKIITGLKICKTKNPVFMIDEIDKMGKHYTGDPASALLEVLDPEQNIDFRDHYLDIPFDLSEVLFITTSNTLDTIPSVLLDRMEVIRLSGYISKEKVEIAKRYIVPKQLKRHGLEKMDIKFSSKILTHIIEMYSREAGLRNFERLIEKVARKIAFITVKGLTPPEEIDEKLIREYLGPERFLDEPADRVKKAGVVTGLAYTTMGGATLMIESIAIPDKKSGIQITGQLGDVMNESAHIAYSYVKSVASDYSIDPEYFSKNLIHLHVPAGATPKDGPSAGVTMATCLLSLATGKKPKAKYGMTGELTLSGLVLPIGGLKEKILAAKRAGLKHVIFPKDNEKDFEEIPEHVKKGIEFHSVSEVKEVFELIL
jgi:ATP-dependent Lon protease